MFTILFAMLCISAGAGPKPTDEPTFAVLQVERAGQKTFKVLLSDEVQAERSRIAKENQTTMAPWEKRSQAFLKEPANKGKPFPEPKPGTTTVTVKRDGFVEKKDAKAFAGNLEEADRKVERKVEEEAEATYAVVKITEQMGLPEVRLEILREDQIEKRCQEIKKDYKEKNRKRQALKHKVLVGANRGNYALTGEFDHKMWFPTTLICLKRGIPEKAEADRLRTEFAKKLKLTKEGNAPK
jgi:hypothetical protein